MAIVIVSMLGVFASIGLGRFALGMLLPSMSKSLGLSYSQMGLLSTLNFFGYLLTALASGMILRYGGTQLTVFLSLLVAGLSMYFIGETETFLIICLLYTLTGLGSGSSNVPLMGLVTQWFESRKRGMIAGILVSGGAMGIVLSSIAVPYMNKLNPVYGWKRGWQFFGLLVILVSFLAFLFIRDRVSLRNGNVRRMTREVFNGDVLLTFGLYFLFGFSYVVYITFLVSFLVNECGMSEPEAGKYWLWVGLLSLLAGPVFGTMSDRVGRARTLMMVFFSQSIAYSLIALKLLFPWGIILSIALFGLVSLSIPSIVAALIGDIVGSKMASSVFGLATFVFGLGQIGGPFIAGIVSDLIGSLRAGFSIATISALLAVSWSFMLWRRGY